jgi:Leucine-rich repeat (LRR) protein
MRLLTGCIAAVATLLACAELPGDPTLDRIIPNLLAEDSIAVVSILNQNGRDADTWRSVCRIEYVAEDETERVIEIRLAGMSPPIVNVPGGELYRLNRLRFLQLDNNDIAQLPLGLGALPQLRRVSVSWNNLLNIPGDLAYAPLAYLDVSSNDLAVLPAELAENTTLDTLRVHGNNLNDLPPAFVNRAYGLLDVEFNALCRQTVTVILANWLDLRQPGWELTQRCGVDSEIIGRWWTEFAGVRFEYRLENSSWFEHVEIPVGGGWADSTWGVYQTDMYPYPHHINLTTTRSRDEPLLRELRLGIYELTPSGDTLKLAIAGPGSARPNEFVVPPPSGVIVHFMTRQY